MILLEHVGDLRMKTGSSHRVHVGTWFLDVGESYLVRAENIAQVEEWILLWHHVRVELDVEVCIRVFCSRGLLRLFGRGLAMRCVYYVGVVFWSCPVFLVFRGDRCGCFSLGNRCVRVS